MDPVYLNNPTYIQLDDAYRGLPVSGSVIVKTSNPEETIFSLEQIGFVAIEVLSYSSEERNYSVRAFKGKHGPCHFKGQHVQYTGYALAALDDDNHILFTGQVLEVCDKTFRIYGLPAYEGLIECDTSDGYGSIEEPDDFESSQVKLYEKLKDSPVHQVQIKSVFYPGPFRLLILADGSMIYRGKWNAVPEDMAADLVRIDRCIISGNGHEGHQLLFQEEFRKYGSACLLRSFCPESFKQMASEPDFSQLKMLSNSFKHRLLNVIQNQRKYFILIGNEADDKLGCCPSEEVTEANRLVNHGILTSLGEPVKVDTCPVTMYAFKGELNITENGFSSTINEEFRKKVHNIIQKSSDSLLQKVLKWTLLVFILISLILAGKKCQELQQAPPGANLYEQLNLSTENPFVVVLFHNRKRCHQCLQMEDFTNDVVNASDPNYNYVFRTVIMDDPENMDLVSSYGIFAPTVIFLEFKNEGIVRSEVLTNLTGLYREEDTFKDQLETELQQFINNRNE